MSPQVTTLRMEQKFKHTSVGDIPVDWQLSNLSELATIIMGQSPPSSACNQIEEGLPFYQGNAEFGRKYPTPRNWCTEPTRRATEKDILISVRAPVGAINIAPHECCIGRGLSAVRAVTVQAQFLYYALETLVPKLTAVAQGSTFEAINSKELAFLPVPFPPIIEQERIAEILSAADDAIEKTSAVIEKTGELKKALLHHLFTRGIGHTRFKQTEIGKIPQEWKVAPLGEIAHVGNGSTPRRSNPSYWTSGTIPWLPSGKIYEGVIKKADELVTDTAVKECHLPLVRAGSLLIAITGQGRTLGNAALTAIDTTISQHLAYAQFNSSEVDPHFMRYYFETQYDHLRQIAGGGGTTKGALTCGFLKEYPVPLPSPPEQKKIADTLETVEMEEHSHEQEQDKLDRVKSGLMNVLLTGQIRVPL